MIDPGWQEWQNNGSKMVRLLGGLVLHVAGKAQGCKSLIAHKKCDVLVVSGTASCRYY